MTGDLVFDTPTPVQDVRVGEVASLPSTYSGKLVTHRITSIAPTDAGFEIRMQGDANEAPDGEPYLVRADASVWQPRLTVAGGGYALEKLAQRGVAVPLLVTLLALMALVVLPGDAEAEGLQAEGSDA